MVSITIVVIPDSTTHVQCGTNDSEVEGAIQIRQDTESEHCVYVKYSNMSQILICIYKLLFCNWAVLAVAYLGGILEPPPFSPAHNN